MLIMINVGALEWQSGLLNFNNDKRSGTARRAPTSDVNGIPELRFVGITHMQRFCSGFPGFPFSREWQSWLLYFNNDERMGMGMTIGVMIC